MARQTTPARSIRPIHGSVQCRPDLGVDHEVGQVIWFIVVAAIPPVHALALELVGKKGLVRQPTIEDRAALTAPLGTA
jgi:hypothetical protein